MKVDQLDINKLDFSLSSLSLSAPAFLLESLNSTGIVSPCLVLRFQSRLILIDGFKRFFWARSQKKNRLPVLIYPVESYQDIFAYCLNLRPGFSDSFLQQSLFLKSFSKGGHLLTESDQKQLILQQKDALSMGQRVLVKDALDLLVFPDEFLKFCLRKSFSYRHLQTLLILPRQAVLHAYHLDKELQWSAASFLEAMTLYKTYIKTQGELSFLNLVESFIDDHQHLSYKVRQKLLLRYLTNLAFPEQKNALNSLKRDVHELSLPKDIYLSWDESLEIHELHLTFKLRDKGRLKSLKTTLSDAFCRDIDDLFDYF